ncbi:RNA polymerase sigma factor [uncultured Dysgonomonas sp.]|uniref:Putative RNA polymerase ECF-type sigma factor n=1 Tax=uncultured Dysgonomonas sp. TaxID=206096 RepID=A0A212K709_9BACT|nr:RNA polymerase sigma factor [uncultured Dysgonomonas sp.]SBW07490.1 putative RNA polymerase ECF-type sigma factor [uncultured Dysgonomonas sp.]
MTVDKDKILLLALQKGDEKAFDLIFHKYHKTIYAFILYNCKSGDDAQDMTQEVFIRLWQNRKNSNIDSLKGYLFTIAKNIFIDWTRQSVNKQIFESVLELKNLSVENEDNTDIEDLFSKIEDAVHNMPEKRLEVYKLRWVDGFSRKEIASKMGITITTVDIHLRKSVQYLKSILSNFIWMYIIF